MLAEDSPTRGINIQTYPHSGENDAPVGVLELWYHAFAYMLAFLLILRLIPCQRRQYGNAAPLGAFVKRDKEFVQDCWGNGKDGRSDEDVGGWEVAAM